MRQLAITRKQATAGVEQADAEADVELARRVLVCDTARRDTFRGWPVAEQLHAGQ